MSWHTRNDLSALLAELLAIVGHDLRNPLGVVLMGAAALTRSPSEAERVRKSADTIARAGDRMNRLIDDVVDYALISSNSPIHFEHAAHPVTVLVADVMERLMPQATGKRINLSVEVDNGVNVLCDRTRTVRVLAHLLGNAIQFTPPGGQVRLSAGREGDHGLFTIEDSGPGMPAEQRARPFERRRGTPKLPGSGVGLGLPISRGLIEAQGGRIWMDAGTGTRVRFTLPIATA